MSEERAAIASYFEHRSQPGRRSGLRDLPEDHPLEPLLRPVRDALDLMGSGRSDRNATQAVLLRECCDSGSTFWAWSDGHWVDVLGRHSRAFRDRNHGCVSQSVRIEIAAVAYLHGWFRDILALGHFQRYTLARRVFGADVVDDAARRVLDPLKQWGYETSTAHLSCLGEALLRNQSPHIEHLTTDSLDRFRRDAVTGRRSLYFQLAKSLAAAGVIASPLPVAHPIPNGTGARIAEGVIARWAEWVERWRRTSTLESRDNLRLHLYKLGRWLGVHHPDVTSPEQWTRDLCAEYVAAACRMRVGDYTVRKIDVPRWGERLAPRAIAAELVAARTFFWDCQTSSSTSAPTGWPALAATSTALASRPSSSSSRPRPTSCACCRRSPSPTTRRPWSMETSSPSTASPPGSPTARPRRGRRPPSSGAAAVPPLRGA